MKQNYSAKMITVFALILISHTNLMAQKFKAEDLNGCWKFGRIEFLEPMPDSLNFLKETKNYIVCFEGNGKFITKQKTSSGERVLGDGTFNLEADGKTITQKRNATDGEVDEPGEIVLLTNKELAIKADMMIIHFERMGD